MFQQGKHRYDEFPPVVVTQIKEIQQLLSDVYPKSYQEWEDGFRRDEHPLREIELWLIVAQGYQHFSESLDVGAHAKQEIFKVLLMRTMQEFNAEQFIAAHTPKYLSQDQVQEILDYYEERRQDRNLASSSPIIVAGDGIDQDG